jgi:C-terminal processing protease CtpA/Prc
MDLKLSRQVIERFGFEPPDSIGQVITYTSTPKDPGENSLRFEGDIYVLINSGTYSSAVMFATTVKDYSIATLIGEESGGLATSYGDIYSFTLPNTRLSVGVSHKRFVRPSGEDDGRGVIPDHVVEGDENDDEDEVMDYTLNLIANTSD